MDPKIKHGIFVWQIENFLLCLPSEKSFAAESPKFTFSRSVWFLNLMVEQNEEGMSFIVQLCRSANCNPGEVTVKFFLSLGSRSVVLASTESEHIFEKSERFDALNFPTSWQGFYGEYAIENEDDILIIVCDMISIKDYSNCCNCHYFTPNFTMTPKEVDDAFLIAEGTAIPANKETLCAYSTVFKNLFQFGDSSLKIEYSRLAVEAMLRFMYSGCIGDILIDGNLPPLDLYECAVEYKVFGLMKCLVPWEINAISVVKCQKIKCFFNHPDLTKFFDKKHHLKHKISEDIEMTICFSYDNRPESMTVTIKLTRKKNLKFLNISMIFFILDFEETKLIRKQHITNLGSAREYSFDFKVEKQSLFIIKERILRRNVLKILCEFKLGYPKESTCIETSDIIYSIDHPQNPEDDGFCLNGKTGINSYYFKEKTFLIDSFDFQCEDAILEHNGFIWPELIFNSHMAY